MLSFFAAASKSLIRWPIAHARAVVFVSKAVEYAYWEIETGPDTASVRHTEVLSDKFKFQVAKEHDLPPIGDWCWGTINAQPT